MSESFSELAQNRAERADGSANNSMLGGPAERARRSAEFPFISGGNLGELIIAVVGSWDRLARRTRHRHQRLAEEHPHRPAAQGRSAASAAQLPHRPSAQTRGADWGLPNRSADSTGITRPIQLILRRNFLQLLPEDRRQGKTMTWKIEGGLRDEIEQLVPARLGTNEWLGNCRRWNVLEARSQRPSAIGSRSTFSRANRIDAGQRTRWSKKAEIGRDEKADFDAPTKTLVRIHSWTLSPTWWGILVILVTVIGVRTQDAWMETTEVEVVQPDEKEVEVVSDLERQASGLTASVHEIENRSKQLESLVGRRERERHQLKVLLTAAKRELSDRRSRLDDDSREQIELATEIDSLASALSTAHRQLASVQSESAESIELEHLPTPLAKTVFGREEHFQLKNGRLSHVPLNVLTDQLKAEIPKKIWKLKQVSEFSGHVRARTRIPSQIHHASPQLSPRSPRRGP